MRKQMIGLVAVAGVVLALASAAQATVIVYDGFDNGTVNLGTLAGQGGGTGFSGNWVFGLNSDTSGYQAAGLTFSNLQVTGGHATMAAPSGAVAARRTVSRPLGVTQTGTIWGSYLIRSPLISVNVAGVLVHTAANGHDDSNTFGVFPTRYGATNGQMRVSAPGTGSNLEFDGSLSTDTTYINLLKFTNLGGGSQLHTLTTWTLTEAQFDNFKAGGMLESALNAASLGTGSTQVVQRGTHSRTTVESLTTTDFFSLHTINAADQAVRFDEVRISNVSLDEVTPIPEPATMGLLALGGVAGLRRRRRR